MTSCVAPEKSDRSKGGNRCSFWCKLTDTTFRPVASSVGTSVASNVDLPLPWSPVICPHQCCSPSRWTTIAADCPAEKTNGIAPGRTKRVENGLEDTLLLPLRLRHNRRQDSRYAAQGERLLNDILATAAEKQPQPHAPLHAQNRAAIAERAVRQAGSQPSHGPQIAVVCITGKSPLEKMDADVIFALAFGMPQDRSLDRLDIGRIDGVDLVFADQLVPRGKATLRPDDTKAEQRLDHARTPAASTGNAGARSALRVTWLPTSTCIVASPGYTTIGKPRSKSGQVSASPRTTSFQRTRLWGD